MKRKTCPYLGLKDDPTTALNFPSEGNFCHRAQPIAPIKGNHQQQFCLTAGHTGCPLFEAAQPVPMPAAMLAAPPPRARPRRILALVGIPMVLIGATTLVWIGMKLGIRPGPSNLIADTGGDPAATSSWSLLVTPLMSTPYQLPTLIPSTPTAVSNCPMPQNWVQYTVAPTDSLFRLSVIYGVSVETLQQVNCMGSETTILPGQVIYVPNTPSFTGTSTPFPPDPTSTPAPANNNSVSPVSAPGVQPPAAPPPPTQVNPPPPTGSGGGNGGNSSGGGGNSSGGGGSGSNPPPGHGKGNGKGHGNGNGNGNGNGKHKGH